MALLLFTVFCQTGERELLYDTKNVILFCVLSETLREREREREKKRNEMNNYLFEHVKVRSRSEFIKRAKQNVFVKQSVTLLSRYKQSHPATTERDKHRHTKQRARERERERGKEFLFLIYYFFQREN